MIERNKLTKEELCKQHSDNEVCEQCCEHWHLDDVICMECGRDLTEDLADAYEYYSNDDKEI